MNQSADTTIYNESYIHSESDLHATPFLKKEYIRVQNEGGANTDFNRNELVWNTISVSNNGKMADFKNAYLEIPVVCRWSTSAVGSDVAAGVGLYAVRMKSAHAIIDSLMIEYNNTTLVQSRRGITSWVSFKEHTTMGESDVKIEGSGYLKPSPEWGYNDLSGLYNGHHRTPGYPLYKIGDNSAALSTANVEASGMDYYRYTAATAADAGGEGIPAVARVPAQHDYYFTLKIPLKKLICFDQLPLVRGANLKITCGLNQCDTSTIYANTNGTISEFTPNIKGSCCPVIIMREDVNAAASTETLSVKVVQNGLLKHKKTTCDLVIPCYTMSADAERDYLSLGSKTITYTDVHVSHIQNKSGDISELLTNSISKLQRLIVVPMLSRQQADNEDNRARPQETPYTMEPACCSPYQISNFQVLLSGVPVYESGGVKYKYDHFINELKGKFGPFAGTQVGLVAGQISEYDYNATMGYFCVDLSRRQSSDFDTPVSVQIQGQINSPLALDFMCFMEFERTATIDLMTSALV